ncbi:glycoside hydrolase family 32 protein [Streptococcus chenjunshii]|uniref:Glycoside hydrolase family 32 protein n=1 Tax=Streptococcus chenjunshii TaxID=2173853 RepID=A0A372KM93_9STRE|nr:glycoside hydrolase family 32 protein [Streptococcus chenjunshii]AXQ79175.1 glycoside hydrolase family 32 protein [Streptococcus chenjunshii]RFU51008.1 glycoside hydrolase family 32 protein [Streptococcus chenjunshii]RFU53402.1 glycoside hydrolase family 32 protein [Streptococcus chenjunshii]
MKKSFRNWAFWGGTAFLAGAAAFGFLQRSTAAETLTSDEHVQKAHLTTAHGWSNDLQTIVWNDEGQYYDIYFLHSADGATQPFGPQGQDWYHTTTADFVHYSEQNSALPSSGGDSKDGWLSAWTGTVIRNDGSVKGAPIEAKVAYFTGIRKSDQQQNIYAAYSSDNGRTFSHVLNEGKAVADINDSETVGGRHPDFRDPNVFYWNNKMLMYIAEGSDIGVYQSNDGLKWEKADKQGESKVVSATFFQGHSWQDNAPVECPVLKTLTMPNGQSRQVLFFGAKDASKGETTGTYYIVGHLDANGLFVPETDARRLDQGSDYYGANFSGSDSIDSSNTSILTLGWVGNWNYFTNGVHSDQEASSPYAQRLGSYSSARQITLQNDLTIAQSLVLPDTVLSHTGTYSNVTKNNPQSEDKKPWVDRQDTNGDVYGLYDIPNQSAVQYYKLDFTNTKGNYSGRIYIDIWQGADYVHFNYDPANGMYNVKQYAAELNNGINGQGAADYYHNGLLGNGNGYLADSQLKEQQNISLQVVTDINSVEFIFPNGQTYTVARFSPSSRQDFKIFTEDPTDGNQVTIETADIG